MDLQSGEQPELPDRLYVLLQNGTMFYTPVEWDVIELDTSAPGAKRKISLFFKKALTFCFLDLSISLNCCNNSNM